MNNKFTAFIAITSLFLSFQSKAFDSSSVEMNAKGKALYQNCVSCHGQNGEGNESLQSPAIAGQYNWYLNKQINNFSQELRGAHEQDKLGAQMLPIVRTLSSKEEISVLSDYIQSLPVIKANISKKGNLGNGSRYYQGKCGACHGGTGQGNKSFNAPKLTGLSEKYLLRQMSNFSKGIRGYKAEDKLGRQMAMMAKTTSGQELDDIVFYILSQENSPVTNK